ncbi:unnamed protein product [Peniophora sp. CBMAI 1063]|nr:unnamed protein product [Peniophora sp. CBMAI 1063]
MLEQFCGMDYPQHLPDYSEDLPVFLHSYQGSAPSTRDTSPWSDGSFTGYSTLPPSSPASISAMGPVSAWPMTLPVDPKAKLLTQACIPLTFGRATAEAYLAHLLGVSPHSDWGVSRGTHEYAGAYRVVLKMDARTLDFDVGSVRGEGVLVPQKLWRPSSDLDHMRLVNNAELQLPIWFDLLTGGVGISLADAVDGQRAELRDKDICVSMKGRATTAIRLLIEGHPKKEAQIHVRDDTQAKAAVTRDRLVRQVGLVVEKIYRALGLISGPGDRHLLLILGIIQVSAGGWQPLLFKRSPPAFSSMAQSMPSLAMTAYST